MSAAFVLDEILLFTTTVVTEMMAFAAPHWCCDSVKVWVVAIIFSVVIALCWLVSNICFVNTVENTVIYVAVVQ